MQIDLFLLVFVGCLALFGNGMTEQEALDAIASLGQGCIAPIVADLTTGNQKVIAKSDSGCELVISGFGMLRNLFEVYNY